MLFNGHDDPHICWSCGKPEKETEVGPLHTKIWKCTNKDCFFGQDFPKPPEDKVALALVYKGIIYSKDITDKNMLKTLSDILYRCEDVGVSPTDVLDMLMIELKTAMKEGLYETKAKFIERRCFKQAADAQGTFLSEEKS